MKRAIQVLPFLFVFATTAAAADLVQLVRLKISAGDVASGAAAAEDYRRKSGIDSEYLNAVGWLARGAVMLGRPDLAREYVAELRRAIPKETAETIVPYGAAIEVESKLIAGSQGRGAALRYLDSELARAEAPALRSRIRKNMNLLSLEGEAAPEIGDGLLAARRGKPVLLYFFAEWCGDCKAQSDSLGRVWQKYKDRGLEMIAVTRLYGGPPGKPITPADEQVKLDNVWKETYAALDGVPLIANTDTMVRYGVSATPTFAIVDRQGKIRLYTPTRLSEAALSQAVEEVLAQ
jgi:thiol-disulfide isomerase/thioredoxin